MPSDKHKMEIHRMKHDLESVRVTAKKNIRIGDLGLDIDMNDGDVMHVPMWLAKVLKKGDIVHVDTPDVIQDLKQATIKEQVVGEYTISHLDEMFYVRMRDALRILDRYEADKIEAQLVELVRMRRGKITRLAATGKITADIRRSITPEELILYKNILKYSEQFSNEVLEWK